MASDDIQKLHSLLRDQGKDKMAQAFAAAIEHDLDDPVLLLIDLKTD